MDKESASTTDIYNLLQGFIKQSTASTEEIKAEIKSIKDDISKEIEDLRQENRELKRLNESLKNRVLKTERRLRKYNLIIYGVPEETEALGDFRTVIKILKEKLKIDCRFEDIRDCLRIGTAADGKKRPILLECVTHALKLEILGNSKNLKGTGIFVSKDYTPEDYQEQKVLREHLNAARNQNKEARIKGNQLIVDGVSYGTGDLKGIPEITRGERHRTVKEVRKQPDILESESSEEEILNSGEGNRNRKRKINSTFLPKDQIKRSNRLRSTKS